MILNDSEISARNLLSPFSFNKVREYQGIKRISYGCSSFGYDISLSDHDFKIFKPGKLIDPKNFCLENLQDTDCTTDDSGAYFILPSYGSGLGVSRELFSIPSDVVGVAVGKSTYARCGVFVNITPLEPDWNGWLTIEIFNATNSPVKIYANEGIAQLLFLKGNKPNTGYGEGKYQNQSNRVEAAKI